MKNRVDEGTLIVDDPNSLEFEEMIRENKPDLILAGIKEKYMAHKLGVPCIMIHSYENGPYIGFEGFLNLAKDMYANIYGPVWKMLEFEENPAEKSFQLETSKELEETESMKKGEEVAK